MGGRSLYNLFLILLVATAAFLPVESQSRVPPGPVKHYVALMLENRSFDHMLGWLKESDKSIRGLNGNETNLWDLNEPKGRVLSVTKAAKDVRFIS